MRIISQDGDIDINYDRHDIWRSFKKIKADDLELGSYSNRKRAHEVMRAIREAYKYVLPDDRSIENKVFQMPQDKGDKE